ncbi:XRE family transcriptional regulator [Gordonia sp. NB41Y]|uniref:helix-turn-helix domain-containing protein n=1 Tax=Gordonia sp. NB41Y TaxID=875808 RepID=UPI0006B22BC5|nr:XRE family transcriptional regulator [Gordonia sp. NB41Y]EMP14457.2 XRE family transcriptional regulator [Gordonia sp. NB41Y]WLP90783.1 XRE family transcriptional regulator [Gordonia sp. NB41Y]
MDDDQAMLARTLGASIRSARKAAGMTMAEVARRADLSQPFLSQVENGNTAPSVINLHKIAQTLGTTAHALLEQGSRQPTTVIRSTDARRYNLGPSAIVRFCLSGTRSLDCNEVTAGAHSGAEAATTHAGEEFVYVISGTVRMNIDGVDHLLEPGDTVHFPATLSHQWFNDTDDEVRFLFVSTPPSF